MQVLEAHNLKLVKILNLDYKCAPFEVHTKTRKNVTFNIF